MRLLTINALAAVALLFSVSLASAETIRMTTTYDSSNQVLAVGDSLSVDTYLFSSAAGGIADPSDFFTVQFSVLYDPSILSYNKTNSRPNLAESPDTAGFEIFGKAGAAATLIILGGSEATYYGTPAQGGPHGEQVDLGGNPLGRVLITYLSKNLVGGASSILSGEFFTGSIAFDVIAAGAPTNIELVYEDGFDGITLDNATGTLLVSGTNGATTRAVEVLSAPIVVHTPEPTTALLLGLGLVGLGVAGRRRA